MTSSDKPGQWTISGRTVLAMLVGFFAVIGAVNAVMIWLAASTHTGIVVDSAWRSSGNWQQEIEAARTQESLGWKMDIEVTRSGSGADFTASVLNASGAPVNGIDLSVRLVSPTGPAGDQVVRLREQDTGYYAGRVDTLTAGRWRLLVDGETEAGRVYRSQNMIVVR
jgi:nitrogen fixation protein FixH